MICNGFMILILCALMVYLMYRLYKINRQVDKEIENMKNLHKSMIQEQKENRKKLAELQQLN